MSEEIALLALAGVATYLIAQPTTTTEAVTVTQPPIVVNQSATDHQLMSVSGFAIYSDSQPTEHWRRAEWAAWAKAQLAATNKSSDAVLDSVWLAWTTLGNQKHINNKQLLWINILGHRLDASITGTPNITADSIPIYDTWSNWWNSVVEWNCMDWLNWYDALAARHGAAVAQSKWKAAWEYEDNWSLGSMGWSCSQTCNIIDEFLQRGINMADTGMLTICQLTNVPYNAAVAVNSASEGIKDTVALLATVLPVAVVVGGSMYLYKEYKKTETIYKKSKKK